MSTQKILILGAGYTGKRIARLARTQGLSVAATTRDEETSTYLQRIEAEVLRWSIGEAPEEWLSHLGPSTTVVYSIPTLFRTYENETGQLSRHVAPIADVISQCRERGADRFIYLSSTSVYGDHGGAWVDETTPCRPTSSLGKMRYDIESYLMGLDLAFPINVARLVGIYGPGRILVDRIKSGRYTLVDGGKGVTNRIHVHDIARAIMALANSDIDENRTFNITDGHPQPARDLVEFICTRLALEPPREETIEDYAKRKKDPNIVARKQNSVRVLNDRIRRELDFTLNYPDVFAGYQAILDEEDENLSE